MNKKIVALSEKVEHLVLGIPSKEEIVRKKKELMPDYVLGRKDKKKYMRNMKLLDNYRDEDDREYPPKYCDWLVEKFSPALFYGGDEERDEALSVLAGEFLYGVFYQDRKRNLVREGQKIKGRVKSIECFCEKLRKCGEVLELQDHIDVEITKLEENIKKSLGLFEVHQNRSFPDGVDSIDDFPVYSRGALNY
ncbi:hypothetical protein HOC37_04070 [bacterium]|jgi:hypothetical protein|nr:hypothetical protein [bacterium]MBT4552145.1 hypothetical protein [bacterium]